MIAKYCLVVVLVLGLVPQYSYARCPSNLKCPNTTVLERISNPSVMLSVRRSMIRSIYATQYFSTLSPLSLKFVQTILSHVDTDSRTFLNLLYAAAAWNLAYFSDAHNYPPMCILAQNINASVIWQQSRDGNPAAAALTVIGSSAGPLCDMLSLASLSALGCNDTPVIPKLQSSCYKRGAVYQLELALNLFGLFLPCNLKFALLDLYNSPDFFDNLLGASFALALVPTGRDIFEAHGQIQIVETLRFVTNNNVSKCCCPVRAQRLRQLCAYHNTTMIANAQHLIDTIYLAPEC